MDRRPTLEARPPVLINAIVRMLIPPVCREHVVGDLWERYRSPWRFLLDAARTVPFVIASQIRRTSTVGSVLIQTFLMFVGIGIGSRRLGPTIVSVVSGVLFFVLRDAYKARLSIFAKQVFVDLLFGAAGIVIPQAVVALAWPHLVFPITGFVAAAGTLGMLFCLRLQNPALGGIPRHAFSQPPANLDMLVIEVRLHEQLGRRAIFIEALAGVILAIFFIFPVVSSPNWMLRIGFVLASAYGLYVAVFVLRHRAQPMPQGLGFRESLAYYRRELARQQGHVQTMWYWYVLPFAPAVVFIMVGSAMAAAERGRPAWPALIMAAIAAGVGLIVHKGSQEAARKLGIRIDILKAAEDQ